MASMFQTKYHANGFFFVFFSELFLLDSTKFCSKERNEAKRTVFGSENGAFGHDVPFSENYFLFWIPFVF